MHLKPCTVHEPDVSRVWTLELTALPNPLLLPRVLQKLAVPSITLEHVTYTATRETVTISLRVCTTAAWAQLVRTRVRRLVGVQDATVVPQD